jgi:hypothetical protein
MSVFVMHKRVRMKESRSVDKCFSFSQIPMTLTILSEQIALVLTTEKRIGQICSAKIISSEDRVALYKYRGIYFSFFPYTFIKIGSVKKSI